MKITDKYIIDIPKFLRFMFLAENDKTLETTDTLIVETFAEDGTEDNMSLISKEISENKKELKSSAIAFSSDLMLSLLQKLLDGDELDKDNFQQQLVFNTLLHYGLLTVVNKIK